MQSIKLLTPENTPLAELRAISGGAGFVITDGIAELGNGIYVTLYDGLIGIYRPVEDSDGNESLFGITLAEEIEPVEKAEEIINAYLSGKTIEEIESELKEI